MKYRLSILEDNEYNFSIPGFNERYLILRKNLKEVLVDLQALFNIVVIIQESQLFIDILNYLLQKNYPFDAIYQIENDENDLNQQNGQKIEQNKNLQQIQEQFKKQKVQLSNKKTNYYDNNKNNQVNSDSDYTSDSNISSDSNSYDSEEEDQDKILTLLDMLEQPHKNIPKDIFLALWDQIIVYKEIECENFSQSSDDNQNDEEQEEDLDENQEDFQNLNSVQQMIKRQKSKTNSQKNGKTKSNLHKYNQKYQVIYDIDQESVDIIFASNSLEIIINYVRQIIQQLQDFSQQQQKLEENELIEYEMAFKACLNIIYMILFNYENPEKKVIQTYEDQKSSKNKENDENNNQVTENEYADAKKLKDEKQKQVINFLDKCQLEAILLQCIQLSLELFVTPIKKIMILMNFYLQYLLTYDEDKQALNKEKIAKMNKKQENKDKNILEKKEGINLFTEENLDAIRKGTPRYFLKDEQSNRAEQFYKKHILNQKDSPLAQIITVGLLRTLLTTCATNNRYQPETKGVNLNREWESSIAHFMQNLGDDEYENLNSDLQSMIEDYKKYQKNPDFCSPNKEFKIGDEISILKLELNRHRITACYNISSIFLFLLKKFKSNSIWQYSYLIQLITDANGVLVFLKFLTEKFNLIPSLMRKMHNDSQKFKIFLSYAVYQIQKLMFLTCNNYPDKINKFLLEYNAHTILRKLPKFLKHPKVVKYGEKLLRIQIPLFSKQMRQQPQNMNILADIYCKSVENSEIQPIIPDDYDCLKNFYVYEKIKDRRKMPQFDQMYNNQEDARKINTSFNNYHYIEAVPEDNIQRKGSQDEDIDSPQKENQQDDNLEEIQKQLERKKQLEKETEMARKINELQQKVYRQKQITQNFLQNDEQITKKNQKKVQQKQQYQQLQGKKNNQQYQQEEENKNNLVDNKENISIQKINSVQDIESLQQEKKQLQQKLQNKVYDRIYQELNQKALQELNLESERQINILLNDERGGYREWMEKNLWEYYD
ncbi:hypothetical protein PPERSA_07884 [Pseudocohnilembus persalinus]|uniref:Far11/STRP C-terminal domain-containing protein n=1 Tax=Pseudocohnilembus persalinus TaxID=266149 RepID=A0A0V0QCF3_PSEPJ|nr:hypothetical protein PPERSA_07884 [Pseudocohnilembus persalinus]|eukprot:KRW99807.1 hypothetical protein PPERSA_07884 [Pseudocohnilembus persalinus]